MPRARARTGVLIVAAVLAAACDKSTPGPDAENAGEVAQPAPDAAQPEAGPADAEPKPQTELAPAPESADAEPEAPAQPSFEASVAALVGDEPPTADDQKTAWTHYKVKDYAGAQRHFARASLHDRSAWKHPFNLACASALAKDAATAELALREALARDREAVAGKAARDQDLAVYRDAPWFVALLAEPKPKGDRPADASPKGGVAPVAPVPKTKGGIPLSVNVPATPGEQAMLATKLAAKHGLQPRVLATLAQVNGAGERAIYAVYDFSLFDQCREVRGETEDECIERLGPGEEGWEEDYLECAEQWFVRAELRGEGGESLVLGEPAELEVACQITQLRLDFVDVDKDGELEVVLDARGKFERDGFRASTVLDVGRVVRVLAADGTEQFGFSLGWGAIEMSPSYEIATRLRLRDVNGDGHPDLVVESMLFMADSLRAYDDELWPKKSDDDDRDIKEEVWLYDVASDTWKQGAK